jgi:hypothetical protein
LGRPFWAAATTIIISPNAPIGNNIGPTMNRKLLVHTNCGFAVFIANVPNRMVSPRLQLNTVIKCCQLEQGRSGATIFSTPILVQENKTTAGRGDDVNRNRQFKISIMLIHNAQLVADPTVSRQIVSISSPSLPFSVVVVFVMVNKFVTMVHRTRNQAAAARKLVTNSQYLPIWKVVEAMVVGLRTGGHVILLLCRCNDEFQYTGCFVVHVGSNVVVFLRVVAISTGWHRRKDNVRYVWLS